jgi:hypothetical protein
MGNMLYQSCDDKSIIKGNKTAKPNNYAVGISLQTSPDLTKSLTKTGHGSK